MPITSTYPKLCKMSRRGLSMPRTNLNTTAPSLPVPELTLGSGTALYNSSLGFSTIRWGIYSTGGYLLFERVVT